MSDMSTIDLSGLDEKTLGELNTLREIRLGLARKQANDAEDTVKALILRGLVDASEEEELVAELKKELQEKIARLEDASFLEHGMIRFDEIDMYIELLEMSV